MYDTRFSQNCRSGHDRMCMQYTPVSEHHIWPDYSERANCDIHADARVRVNFGAWMNLRARVFMWRTHGVLRLGLA
jgi:hypothetical protein